MSETKEIICVVGGFFLVLAFIIALFGGAIRLFVWAAFG